APHGRGPRSAEAHGDVPHHRPRARAGSPRDPVRPQGPPRAPDRLTARGHGAPRPVPRRHREHPMRLNEAQLTILFVVNNSGPVSVADVAGHTLTDDSWARHRLATLERRGLVSRTYTGHHRGSSFAYNITGKGESVLR